MQKLFIFNYIHLIIFFLLTTLFGLFLYLLNFMLYSLKEQRYKNRHLFKTYEFGTITLNNLQTLSNSHFFVLSVLFIIFDVEIFLMYLWVININSSQVFIYKFSFLIFISLLIIGIIYELINGLLNWYKPKLK